MLERVVSHPLGVPTAKPSLWPSRRAKQETARSIQHQQASDIVELRHLVAEQHAEIELLKVFMDAGEAANLRELVREEVRGHLSASQAAPPGLGEAHERCSAKAPTPHRARDGDARAPSSPGKPWHVKAGATEVFEIHSDTDSVSLGVDAESPEKDTSEALDPGQAAPEVAISFPKWTRRRAHVAPLVPPCTLAWCCESNCRLPGHGGGTGQRQCHAQQVGRVEQ